MYLSIRKNLLNFGSHENFIIDVFGRGSFKYILEALQIQTVDLDWIHLGRDLCSPSADCF